MRTHHAVFRNFAILAVLQVDALVVKNPLSSGPARVLYHRSGVFCPSWIETGHGQPIRANLTLANPESGCTPLLNEVTESLVLVFRGGCTFEEKVKNVENAGAKAVVVGNNDPESGLVIMSASDEYRSTIPCVMIRLNGYENVKMGIVQNALFEGGTMYEENLMKGQLDDRGELPINPSLPYNLPVKIATLLLIVLPTLWAGLAVLMLIRRCINGYTSRRARMRRMVDIPMVTFIPRQLSEENGRPEPISPARSESDIRRRVSPRKRENMVSPNARRNDQRALIENHGTSDGEIIHNNTCAVCIDDFEPQERVKRLPCGHAFHRDCIDPWLVDSDKCPICKRSIFEDDARRPGLFRRSLQWIRSRNRSWRRVPEQAENEQYDGYPGMVNNAAPERSDWI